MPTFPNWAVFQRVDAATLNSIPPNFVYKLNSLPSVVSSTTVVNDAELVVSGAAGTFYVEFGILYSSPAAAAFKTQWATTGTVTGTPIRHMVGVLGSATNDAGTGAIGFSYGNVYGAMLQGAGYAGRNTANSPGACKEWSIVQFTTAWSITLQYAQAVSNAGATAVVAGSYVSAKQIA